MILKKIYKNLLLSILTFILLFSCGDDKINQLKIGDPAPFFKPARLSRGETLLSLFDKSKIHDNSG